MSNVSKRGFGSMDPKKRREICSRGGKSAHAKGTAHEWTTEEAQAAGRKGGIASNGGRGKQRRPFVVEDYPDECANDPRRI